MTLKDAEIIRQLKSRVDSLERSNTDLVRRMDDLSKAHRLLVEQIEAKPKRAA